MNSEVKLISAVLKNKDISTLMAGNVDDLFTSHRDIWEYIKRYYYKHKSVPDAEVVIEKHRDFEPADVKGATEFYVDNLRDDYVKSVMRQLFIEQNGSMKEEAGSKVLQETLNKLSALNRVTSQVKDLDITDIESAESYFKQQAERTAAMGGTPGIPTGFSSIDSAYVTGMAPGHLIVAIGWPGRGKTWFTSYMACKAHDAGFRPMIVSLEMSPEQMRERIYTMMGSGLFRNSELSRGNVNLDDFRAWGSKKFTGKTGFHIVSPEGYDTVTPNMIQAKVDQYHPDLIICDYHQLFEDNKQSRNEVERNKNVSREFKQLAMRNKIPVIDITAATSDDISQRESPPMLSQVAWSKAIEYDADMALAIHKDKESNLIEIVSIKNRYGPDFGMYLDWDIDKGVITEVFQ